MSHTQEEIIVTRYGRDSPTKNFFFRAKYKERIIYQENHYKSYTKSIEKGKSINKEDFADMKKHSSRKFSIFIYDKGIRYDLSQSEAFDLYEILKYDFKTPIEILFSWVKV